MFSPPAVSRWIKALTPTTSPLIAKSGPPLLPGLISALVCTSQRFPPVSRNTRETTPSVSEATPGIECVQRVAHCENARALRGAGAAEARRHEVLGAANGEDGQVSRGVGAEDGRVMPRPVLDLHANAARGLFDDVMVRYDDRPAGRVRLDDDAGACAAPRRYLDDAGPDAVGDRLEASLRRRRTRRRRRGWPWRGRGAWGRRRSRRADRSCAVRRSGRRSPSRGGRPCWVGRRRGRWRPCWGGRPSGVRRPGGSAVGHRRAGRARRGRGIRRADELMRRGRSGGGGYGRCRRRFLVQVDHHGDDGDDGGERPEPSPSASARRAAARSRLPAAAAAARAPACRLALPLPVLRLPPAPGCSEATAPRPLQREHSAAPARMLSDPTIKARASDTSCIRKVASGALFRSG